MQKITSKKWLILLIATVLAFVMIFACACDNDTKINDNDGDNQQNQGEQNNGGNDEDDGNGEIVGDVNYSVLLQKNNGDPISNITIIVKSGSEIKSFGATGKDGKYSFTLPADTYSVELRSMPEEYNAEQFYTLTATAPNLELKFTALNISVPNVKYKSGDKIDDFSFTDTTGKFNTLSNVMQTKKAVLLNFWYVDCRFCVQEFPGLKNAYLLYADDVEVIAINPYDAKAQCEAFRKNTSKNYAWDELPFIMLSKENACATALANNFSVTGYPTSVLIDSDGVIRFIKSGMETESTFVSWFAEYTR